MPLKFKPNLEGQQFLCQHTKNFVLDIMSSEVHTKHLCMCNMFSPIVIGYSYK